MGVFDDAIRQHLDLKRQTGADESELKELEDEAFGQAARPGDPDFPGSTSDEAAVDEGAEDSAETDIPAHEASAEAATADVAPAEAPAAEPPAADQFEGDSTEESPLLPFGQTGEPEVEAAPELEPESAELEVPPAEEPEDSGPDPEPAEAESSFSTSEREAIADQPTVFFDQTPADLELGDLELDFDEEIEEVGGSLSEPLPDEEPLVVEEVFEEPAAEVAQPPHEVEPDSLEPDTSDQPQPEGDAEAEPVTGEEDVLEETPEFLRENPDDDELWFEQGEPKDFDF